MINAKLILLLVKPRQAVSLGGGVKSIVISVIGDCIYVMNPLHCPGWEK